MASFVVPVLAILTIMDFILIEWSASCQLSLDTQVVESRKWPYIAEADRRDYIEYIVSYKHNVYETVNFQPKNTRRFQPMRWFNINSSSTVEIRLIYENFFYIFRSMFDIQKIYLDINISPRDCLEKVTYEEIEDKTRRYLLHEIKPKNSKICSAHIEDNKGTGTVVFNCCEVEKSTDIKCDTVHEGSLQYSIQILCIVAAIFTCVGILYLSSQPSIGSKKFYFYPKNMTVKFVSQSTTDDGKLVKTARCTNLPFLTTPLEGLTANEVKTVKRITLRVPKSNCVDEDDLSMSIIRCLTDLMTDLTSSYYKRNRCLLSTSWCPKCITDRCCRIAWGRICLGIFFLGITAPLIIVCYYVYWKETDFKQLCEAYRQNSLACPFYLTYLPFFWTIIITIIPYWAIIVFYISTPIHFPTYFISEYRNNGKEYQKKKFVFYLLATLFILSTWACILFCIFYFLARVIIISSRTKKITDDLALAVLPMMAVITDKFMDVTDKYKVITGFLFNLARKEDKFKAEKASRNTDKNCSQIIPIGSTVFDPKLEIYCCQLRLKLNLPLIFVQPKERLMISKKIISLMYSSTPSCLPFELNNYLKAFLWSLVPCSFYFMLFFLFLNFGSVYAHTTEIAGYASFALTAIGFLKTRPQSWFKSFLISDNTPGEKFKSELEERLANYEEAWTVTELTLEGDEEPEQPAVEEIAQVELSEDEAVTEPLNHALVLNIEENSCC